MHVLYEQSICETAPDITIAGRVRISDFHGDRFAAGSPHTIDVEAELFPEITYSRPYDDLEIQLEMANMPSKQLSDEELLEKINDVSIICRVQCVFSAYGYGLIR